MLVVGVPSRSFRILQRFAALSSVSVFCPLAPSLSRNAYALGERVALRDRDRVLRVQYEVLRLFLSESVAV